MTSAIRKRAARAVLTVGLVMAVASCSSISTNIVPLDDDEFAAFLGIDLAQMNLSSSGLYWIDTVVGTGIEALEGEGLTATVLFSGWLKNGALFDTGTIAFPLGPEANVVPGFFEGVVGMKIGGIRKLVLPPELAYGAAGNGPIPPNATIVFEVALALVE